MELVIRGFFGGASVLFLSVMWASNAGLLLQTTAGAIIGSVVTVLLLILTWSVWRNGFSPGLGVFIAAVGLPGLLLCGIFAVGARADGASWWPTVILALPLLYILLALPGWRGAALSAGLVIVTVVGRLIGMDNAPELAVVEVLGACAAAVAVAQGGRVLRRVGQVNDTRQRRSLAQQAAETRSLGKEAHARWVDQFLHDEVAHALRAVALSEQLSEPEVRGFAAEVTGRLTDLTVTEPPAADLAEQLAAVVADSGLRVTLELEPVDITPDAAVALCAAVRESLRNVRRHAGVDQARVVVQPHADGVQVEIVDAGRGFRVSAVPGDRYGVRDGIIGRLADVGGRADIDSGPTGTRVRLTWVPESTGDGDWVEQVRARVVILLISGPFVVACILQCLLRAGQLRYPAAAVLGTALVATMWSIGAWRYRNRDISGRMNLAMIGTAIVAICLGAHALPVGAGDPTYYWLASSAMPLVAFAMVSRPWIECLLGIGAVALLPTVLILVSGGPGQVVSLSGALFAAVALAPLIVGGAWFTQRGVRQAAEDNEAREQSVVRQIEADLREQALRDRVGGLRDRIRPFLAGVADGSERPTDPSVRRQAAVLEAWVRDGLGDPGNQWPPALTAPVEQLRQRGATVTLSQAAPLPVGQVDAVDQILQLLARAERAPRRVGVANTPGPGGVRTTVTVRPYDEASLLRLRALPGVSISTDETSYFLIQSAVSGVRRTVPGPSSKAMMGQ